MCWRCQRAGTRPTDPPFLEPAPDRSPCGVCQSAGVAHRARPVLLAHRVGNTQLPPLQRHLMPVDPAAARNIRIGNRAEQRDFSLRPWTTAAGLPRRFDTQRATFPEYGRRGHPDPISDDMVRKYSQPADLLLRPRVAPFIRRQTIRRYASPPPLVFDGRRGDSDAIGDLGVGGSPQQCDFCRGPSRVATGPSKGSSYLAQHSFSPHLLDRDIKCVSEYLVRTRAELIDQRLGDLHTLCLGGHAGHG